MPEAAAAPKVIAGTLAYVGQMFTYVQTGWISSHGVAAAVPGVVTGLNDISVGQGKITLSFSLRIGDAVIPAKLEITSTVISLVVPPAMRMSLPYAIPYWDTLMSLLAGRETPVKGTEYAITLPTYPTKKVPAISAVAGNAPKVTITFPAPYPKVGSGMLWAYMRGIDIDPEGATLDIYRPVLGFDLAKNPRVLWAK